MSADLLRQLLALDLSTEQALAVMDIIENRDGDRKEKARARWHKWNDKRLPNVSKREPTLANVSKPTHASATEENKQTNKQENKEERKQDAPAAHVGFSDFWALFPNKVGKRDAEAAFLKALHRADLATILAGLRRYAAKTDDRPWCNPTTFLNQDRWDDQPADPQRRQNGHSPPNGKRMNAVEAMLSLQAERENEQTSGTIDHGDDELFPPDQPGLPRLASDLGQVVEWPVRRSDYQRG